MFLDDFVLRHYNTTEAEKHYIKDTIIKANKFGSTKHYEEAYQNLINTFWSQIKYSLTSLQPCMYLKEDRDLIKNLLMSMLNFQETELTVEKEDIIGRVLHFLESAKVRQNDKYIWCLKTQLTVNVLYQQTAIIRKSVYESDSLSTKSITAKI